MAISHSPCHTNRDLWNSPYPQADIQEMPKVAKLEKQKEKEIAKAKNEANKKMFAMQVIQAVA